MKEPNILRKLVFIIIILFFFFSLIAEGVEEATDSSEKGKLLIYYSGQEAGFEEYEFVALKDGYIIEIKGKLTQPVLIVTKKMKIEVDREFKPRKFYWKLIAQGVSQEIKTVVEKGVARNRIRIAGQSQTISSEISSDSFFLPNNTFSPYLALTKKLKCDLRRQTTFRAFIVDRVREVKFLIEVDKANPCRYSINLAGRVNLEIGSSENGELLSLRVPSQGFKAVKVRSGEKNKKGQEASYFHEILKKERIRLGY